ncbi:MAG: hypothetical protein JKX85_01010 [Phycisphaeraceae bacterium]|nr:hypothetical protein [Phycisphaeraceae bacterium]
MSWVFFIIMTYVLVAFETGLGSLFVVGDSVLPNLLFILGIFISIYAPQSTTLWAMLILGVITDLVFPIQGVGPVSDFVLVGPNAAGFMLGGWVALQLRGIFRRSLPGIVMTVMIAFFFSQLLVVAILTMRGLPWPIAEPVAGWSAADELVRRFWCLLYTMLLSVPLIYLLGGSIKLFHFDPHRSGPAGYIMR